MERGAGITFPQSVEEGTYFPGRGPDDEWLDWNDTSLHLHNKIRGITRPGPGARTLVGDSEVRIWRAFLDPSWPTYIAIPGVVVGRCVDGVRVKTRDSTLLIQEIQRAGRPPELPTWRPGTRLGVDIPCTLTALKAKIEMQEFLCNADCKQ
jgi:methionyl-tRNA formyltransferase